MKRLPALALLLALGILSLPLSAYFLDGARTENWIMPAQLGAMALLGALVALVLPLARDGASGIRKATIGAVAGMGMALVGIVIFWFLLNGLSGA
ncbi:hypothetical protein [Lolliginicoccus suaedae]|uniref:hypothetical protein n=1 Tax=Lolliginicoccus suaedae TaxID=2605429 RepID=UPI0011EF1E08|nr:hypothetical protein [Lolliginicoccus suaedae]